MSLPIHPYGQRRMLFCERSFGVFLLLWGTLLLIDNLVTVARLGLFYGQMQSYMPSWAWGALMIGLAISRFLAFKSQSAAWRVRLSAATFVLMVVIASISAWTGLWGATAPLAGFVAYVAFWCHSALLRDLRLGL